MLTDIEKRIERLEQKLHQIVRVGTVTTLLPEKGMVRVRIADADGLLTYELPVLFPKTAQDKYYQMPDSGEHVLCVFLPIGLEQGFVIGAFYSTADTVPVADNDTAHVRFSDGTSIAYDRAGHVLTMDIQGDVVIRVTGDVDLDADGEVTIDAPHVRLNHGTGVVTGECICHFTGHPHADLSETVFAGKEPEEA